MAFEPGDIVQLKSGSPALTVVSVTGEDVLVLWFAEEEGEFHERSLPAVTLDKLEIADFDDEDEDEEEDEDED